MSASVNLEQLLEKNLAFLDQNPAYSSIDVQKDSLENIQKILKPSFFLERQNWANFKDKKGMTPLAKAVEAHTSTTNKMDIIAFLINDCGAYPNLGDNDNWTPLYRAATGTRSDALLFILNHQADPNIPNKDGSTPLHRLVDRGHEEDVQTLLANHAVVNAINCFGTPLAYAAKNGNIRIATILLNAGADPNLVDDPLGATPVQLAENNGKEEMKQLLLSRNGLTHVPEDSKVHTSLSLLVIKGNEAEIKQSFIKGEKDKYGRSVTHYCAFMGRLDLLSQFYCMEPDVKGRTPLHYAIIKGHEEAVKLLIGAEINSPLDIKDYQGYSPLMLACQYNRVNIAKALLERAREKNMLNHILDIADNFGWKAIHKAAQVGNVTLVRMFVEEYKVDHMITTSNGRSPLDLAQTTHAEEVISYLKSLNLTNPGFIRV